MEIYFSAAPEERGGDVEDEGEIDVAMCVDVSPTPVEEYGSETLGELIGLLETQRDDLVPIEVDIAEETVAFNKGEAVVIDVFVTFGGIVCILDWEDDAVEGVDDAVAVADAH